MFVLEVPTAPVKPSSNTTVPNAPLRVDVFNDVKLAVIAGEPAGNRTLSVADGTPEGDQLPDTFKSPVDVSNQVLFATAMSYC
jgi:hypothetical protein